MMHVVLLGAGMIGAALADTLVHAGVSVTVIDAERPGSGTSGSSLAWLNANQKLPRHYHDLSVRAMAGWRDLAREFGSPPWYVPTGSLTWVRTDEERDALDRRLERLRSWGYAAEELSAGRAAELEPALRVPSGAQVAYFADEGFVHGDLAVEALLARATAGGARKIVSGGEVTLETRGSRIVAARLPGGERVHADVFAVCAGWRTPSLLEPLGVTIPLIAANEPGSAAPCLVARTSGSAPISRVINTPTLSLRPLFRRGLQLEAGDVNDRVDAGTPPADLARHGADLLDRAGVMITGFDPGEARYRLCFRPLPVDGHPIVGRLPEVSNAYVIVTHSGMTLAPVLARLAGAEIVDGGSGDDLEPYRPTRFVTADRQA